MAGEHARKRQRGLVLGGGERVADEAEAGEAAASVPRPFLATAARCESDEPSRGELAQARYETEIWPEIEAVLGGLLRGDDSAMASFSLSWLVHRAFAAVSEGLATRMYGDVLEVVRVGVGQAAANSPDALDVALNGYSRARSIFPAWFYHLDRIYLAPVLHTTLVDATDAIVASAVERFSNNSLPHVPPPIPLPPGAGLAPMDTGLPSSTASAPSTRQQQSRARPAYIRKRPRSRSGSRSGSRSRSTSPHAALVINAGSSSLKARLYLRPKTCGKGQRQQVQATDMAGGEIFSTMISGIETASGMAAAVAEVLTEAKAADVELDLVAHRVVHGGRERAGAVVVDDVVRASIAEAAVHAPLHNPPALLALEACAAAAGPYVPQVAVFDTAPHVAGMAACAYTVPVRTQLADAASVRKYGFHGSSHAYVAEAAAAALGLAPEAAAVVTAHLGSGASVAAIDGGRVVDTSMGFSPLGGLVMATRPGDMDPGAVLALGRALLADEKLGAAELLDALGDELASRSGLMGMAGTRSMRQVLAGAAAGDAHCILARDVYIHRLVFQLHGHIGLLSRAPDAIVFTGGVGEASAIVRSLACSPLLSASLDVSANRDDEVAAALARHGYADISSGKGDIRLLVVSTNEEAYIAAQAYPVLLGPNVCVGLPNESRLYFDAAVNKVVVVTGQTELRAISSPPTLYTRHGLRSVAYDDPTALEMLLPDRGPLLTCPRLALDFTFVALIRSTRLVEFVPIPLHLRPGQSAPSPASRGPGPAVAAADSRSASAGLTSSRKKARRSGSAAGGGKSIMLTCKASREPMLIFDGGWPYVGNFFLVTSQTLELYGYSSSKGTFKLLKSHSLAIHWHVYSHVAKVILLATNEQGTVLQPFLFKPDGLVKLPKLRIAARTGASKVSAADVHLAVVYHKVFLIHINAADGCAALYLINRDEAVLRAELPIARGCTHRLSIIDQLLVFHNVDQGSVLIYDIKVSCRNPLDKPRPLPAPGSAPPPTLTYPFAPLPALATPDSADSANSSDGTSSPRTPRRGRRPWLYFAPDLVMEPESGRIFSLLLDLSALAANFTDARRRIAFLLKREHCKVLVLHTIREMIWAKASLNAIGQVFDMINEICNLAQRERAEAELAQLHSAAAANSKRKSRRGWTSWFSSSSSSSSPSASAAAAAAEAPTATLSAQGGPARPASAPPAAHTAARDVPFGGSRLPATSSAASPSASSLLPLTGSATSDLASKYAELGGTIPLQRVPSPADADVFGALVRSSLATSSQLLFEPPLGALGVSPELVSSLGSAAAAAASEVATSPLLVTARTKDGFAIIEQKEIYSFVLASMVEEARELTPKFKLAVLMEYIRSLSFNSRPVQHYLYELIINLLVAEAKFHQLHQLIQYHVVMDSTPVALQLLSLDAVYPPAFQLALDMLKRLHTHEEIVEVLLSRNYVLPALRFIREHGFRSVPVKRFLRLALDSGDTPLFHTVFTFFAQRNLYLRGNEAFLPEEECDEFVAAFAALYAA
ncbi:uncharacterized protein AMSG_11941 [Thecamonas trahens ATCC 50062]|uniref:Probable acetate kinase n=1 Tax=Thecamonas trahens ATCC 50062 TaxID=461836 RepID=A0A0L0DCK8_THETB|nr:hypothetical protein AMSG_11941 [Thecamonas trahens ATCC 50062]KNC49841.1 hypothetical protein AMSG_11941 [Thecamonas trahens ATCC 50062]|eukprot:XP_013757441.1 hypothetical protein AMSG_11941 [Thecamonas trahens ATCC 50062]